MRRFRAMGLKCLRTSIACAFGFKPFFKTLVFRAGN